MATHVPNGYSAEVTLPLQDIKVMPYWVTLHVSVKCYAHRTPDRYWYLCLSHTCTVTQTAGVPTTICWQSDSQSLLLRTWAHLHRARSAQLILHW